MDTETAIMDGVWYRFEYNGRPRKVYACPDSDGDGWLLLTPTEYEANDGGQVDFTADAAGAIRFQGEPTGLSSNGLTPA